MPWKFGFVTPFEAKYLVSGPAPPGRVLNHVRRIKNADYSTLVRGPNDLRKSVARSGRVLAPNVEPSNGHQEKVA